MLFINYSISSQQSKCQTALAESPLRLLLAWFQNANNIASMIFDFFSPDYNSMGEITMQTLSWKKKGEGDEENVAAWCKGAMGSEIQT